MDMHNLENAGKLDLEFGTDGIEIIQSKYSSIDITGIQIGADKKIYVAGTVESAFVLGRCHADGTLDTGYGDAGFVDWAYDGFHMVGAGVSSFAFRPDGKVVVQCAVLGSAGQQGAAFSRIDVNGKIDVGFGNDGHFVPDIVLSPPASQQPPIEPNESRRNGLVQAHGQATLACPLQLLPDGKILASVNYFFSFGTSQGLLIRLEEKGHLDTSFNQIGYITVSHPDYLLNATILKSIMVQADGKYLGCGWVHDSSSPASAMFVRFDTNGKEDPKFGENGFVTVSGKGLDLLVQFMVQQPNQRILGVGDTLGDKAFMISIEPDGTPNIQFNGGKPFDIDLEPGALTSFFGGAIQKNGRIVVAGGLGHANSQVDIVVARFIDALFDGDFNEGKGWVRTHVQDGVEYATGLTLQEDGKILICAKLPNNQSALLRYHA
ncbi:hypothetical protein [Pseudomonas fluorescens]|jgi:uncharacterized delta-60 repeat protein|uniref:hypothetical protein n=1 Tax=Pseudomonas fluorescens TaxID=294 RepID=UPI00054BA0F3|nr:hypothetical protein [Pseudomonas fluorescens]KII35395.1 hypothetical protein RY26_12020 [Pseudomonas fluorescens]